jgi:hypothetical protein
VVQFCTIHPPMVAQTCNLIWPDRSLNAYIYPNQHLMAPNGHPNEAGHRLLRDRLIPEIERVILA